jgi:hypothetical protein
MSPAAQCQNIARANRTAAHDVPRTAGKMIIEKCQVPARPRRGRAGDAVITQITTIGGAPASISGADRTRRS